MVQTRQKVFLIVPKCPKLSQVVTKCPKMPTSDASLSERTCLPLEGKIPWAAESLKALFVVIEKLRETRNSTIEGPSGLDSR